MDAPQSGRRIGRYALAAAALVAIFAVALRYRHAAPPPSAADPNAHAIAPMVTGLEARLRASPGDVAGWRMLGQSYFTLGRFAEAARAYARATALAPRNAADWSALGEALVYAHRAGVDTQAAHAFERALAFDPKDPRARYFLAVRKDLAGDHKGAIEDWIALLHDTPPGAAWEQSLRELVAQVAAREKIDIAGRLPRAAESDAIPGPSSEQMADAARLNPSEQQGMARAMVDRLAARLARDPHDAAGWMRLMRARQVLGDAAGARAAYASARAAFAGDTATLTTLGQAADALGLRR